MILIPTWFIWWQCSRRQEYKLCLTVWQTCYRATPLPVSNPHMTIVWRCHSRFTIEVLCDIFFWFLVANCRCRLPSRTFFYVHRSNGKNVTVTKLIEQLEIDVKPVSMKIMYPMLSNMVSPNRMSFIKVYIKFLPERSSSAPRYDRCQS